MQLIQDISDKLYQWRRRMATGGVTLLAVMLAYHVVFGANGWMAYHQKKVEYQRLMVEVQQMQGDNEKLDSRIKSLKSDPKAIEKEAREQWRYVRPGEVVYTLPAPRPAQQQNTATAQNR